MCASVAAMLEADSQCYIRSAGSRGVAIYEEIVASGAIAVCATTDDGIHLPLHLPPIDLAYKDRTNGSYSHLERITVAFFHAPLCRMGLSIDDFRGYSFSSIQHISDHTVTSVGAYQPSSDTVDPPGSNMCASHLELIGFEEVVSIHNCFGASFTNLVKLDVTPFQNVQVIGDRFCSECPALVSINLGVLRSLTCIGDNFLSDCSALEAVNLDSFSDVTYIGAFFMCDCTSLAHLDLTGLRSVTTLLEGFLSRCRSLRTIDVSPLGHLDVINDCFLYGCTSLTSIDTRGLTNLHTIGYGFMGRCTALTSIDLSTLASVERIGGYILEGCTSLTINPATLTPVLRDRLAESGLNH